jgi:hypothetical protein
MRELTAKPLLLVLTLVLVVGAIVFIELRIDAPGADAAGTQANADKQPNSAHQSDAKAGGKTKVVGEKKKQTVTDSSDDTERNAPQKPEADKGPKPAVSDAERIASKENKYTRAREITGSTGLINTDGVSIKDAAGEKVVLVEFWTYS